MSEPTTAILSKARGTFFKPLYEAFAQAQPRPWRTLLIWPEASRNEHPDEAVTPQAENLDLRMVSAAGAGNTFLPTRAAWRLLKQHNVRVVLIHEFSPFTLQGLVYAKLNGVPVVVSTEVGQRNAHFFGRRTRLWHSFWGRWADGIAACCPAAHEPLSGKQPPTISTYHAVDSRLYTPALRLKPSDAPVVFGYAGQMIHRKGLDLFLLAAAELKRRGESNFKLRFIGGGDTDWLHQLAQAHDVEDHLEFTGFQSGLALRQAIQGADVFVLPTRQDTYGAVVHEAACLGLPLLVSEQAGAATLVQEGRNGFVIDPENINAFAGVMKWLTDPALRAEMATVSREIGESHSAHLRGHSLWDWMEKSFLRQTPVPRKPVARRIQTQSSS
jgi:glycosyltransferase involved in cell wall biosynthesis